MLTQLSHAIASPSANATNAKYMGWRTTAYGPRVTSSCSRFTAKLAENQRPSASFAQIASAESGQAQRHEAHAGVLVGVGSRG